MRRFQKPILVLLLIISISINFISKRNNYKVFVFNNANTQDNYETIHNIKDAHTISTGKNVKIGILDKYFGYSIHSDLYSGGYNFTENKNDFENIDEHGYWMANTLREIAPGSEIFALNIRSNNEQKTANCIKNAVDWAIDNKLDILTYSAESFTPESNVIIDEAINKAIKNNIIIIFIHCMHKDNILPYGFFNIPDTYSREPDVKIYHKDFNVLYHFL